jgi:hypothetical protein
LALALFACVTLPFLWGSSGGNGNGPSAESKFIGAAKCKNCHSAAESGDQFGAWEKAKHSHAFEVLASEEAKKSAASREITDPQANDACVKCHVTGFGLPEESFKRGFKKEAGVQCETCHGGGEDHMKARFKAAAAGAAAEGYQAVPEGEVIVTPGVQVCVACHNPESPNYKTFCYFEARAQVAHLNPLKPRTEEEKAAYGKCPCGVPCPHAEGCPEGVCNLKPEELSALKQ